MKYAKREMLIDCITPALIAVCGIGGIAVLVSGITIRATPVSAQSPDRNGRLNAAQVVEVPVPAAVGVQLGPLPAGTTPGNLVGLDPGPAADSVSLAPIRVGVGLQLRSGTLELIFPYQSRQGRVYGEDLTSQVDGSRTVFTFSRPYVPGSEQVRVNGLTSIRDRHYTVEGSPALGVRFLGPPPAVVDGSPDTVAVDYDVAP